MMTVLRNPAAGGARNVRLWPEIEAGLARVFPAFEVVETRRGQTAQQARAAVEAGAEHILAIGGDGTISAAADGILRSSRPDVPLSFLPAGTGADFARNFLWPATLADRLAALADAPQTRLDVIAVERWTGGRWDHVSHAVNIASAGVSGEIIAAMAGRSGFRQSLPFTLRYRLNCIHGILRYAQKSLQILVDGEEVASGPMLVVAVCNGGWFGAGINAGPDARPDDGLLDVIIARGSHVAGNLAVFSAFDRGTHLSHSRVIKVQGRVVELLPLTGPAASAEADGEIMPSAPLRLSVLPQALNVRLSALKGKWLK
ncbi:diacylglycerol/lipid kinase family protein [Rhizobium paknamense]|uniref:Diacylglycerol kinase (ATP) n=1 Tax=Rhizobium paknamense TaxID=1206817 RepID=A0ABU0IA65_9HYPH|nr:diacylglycerol kinase family protein [Rhizobium paknamense]MDQ0455111.1 diacylglycerol kinase (ATP) [Rhizobium paknamense]